jgi:predicted nucleic acid-binding protein
VGLRSLDAIHLVTALELTADLEAVVSYDSRLREAAEANGLGVAAPS